MGNLVSTYIAEYTIVIVGDDVSVRKEILQCLGEEIAQNEYISLHTNKGYIKLNLLGSNKILNKVDVYKQADSVIIIYEKQWSPPANTRIVKKWIDDFHSLDVYPFFTVCCMEDISQESLPALDIEEDIEHIYIGKEFTLSKSIEIIETLLQKMSHMTDIKLV